MNNNKSLVYNFKQSSIEKTMKLNKYKKEFTDTLKQWEHLT